MKILNFLFSYIFFILLLFSCKPNNTTNLNPQNSSRAYSNFYKAPIFKSDDRKEKIKNIAPELQKLIIEHAKSAIIPGIAYGIVVDNELVISSATGFINVEKASPSNPSSYFRIASMTKSFTAMAIMKLRDEGKLSLEDQVSKYIPEMSTLEYLTKDASIIDIENLLTMTAGFPEDNPWGDRQLEESDKMLIDLIESGISFSNAPSFEFEYSNTGYAMLGNIVSQVSGISFQEYITENILHPLGMNHTIWEYDSIPPDQLVMGYRWENEEWKLEPLLHDGSYGAMGGLITTIEDFSKYVSFHLSAWPPRSDEDMGPIKRSTLREMQTPQYSRLNLNDKTCPSISGYGFGLGIGTTCDGLIRVGHGGALPGFGSDYRFYPEYGVGIMAFCNRTYTSAYPREKIEKLLFETIGLEPRKLPVSDILVERQTQIMELIQNWDPNLEAIILAENFFMDKSRDIRMSEMQGLLIQAGEIKNIDEVRPDNQLRGRFKANTQNGIIDIFFTLTPEKDPKIQQLDVSFQPNK